VRGRPGSIEPSVPLLLDPPVATYLASLPEIATEGVVQPIARQLGLHPA